MGPMIKRLFAYWAAKTLAAIGRRHDGKVRERARAVLRWGRGSGRHNGDRAHGQRG